MSDTHELHRDIHHVPDGDILIHSGDFTMFSKSLSAILDFNAWFGERPHPYKIVVPGNHEFFLEADPSRRSLLSNATVLINEGVDIEGLKIWGTPTTPMDGGAFGRSAQRDRVKIYSQIPTDTAIVVSHGPPFGVLDQPAASEIHSGDRELFDAVMRVKPRLHCFGHIHPAYGVFQSAYTTFVNAALLGPHGSLDKSPWVFDIRAIE